MKKSKIPIEGDGPIYRKKDLVIVGDDIWEYVGELLEHIDEIAEIIHMEMPLRYQDKWLRGIMDKGIWKPDTDRDVGVCCRNGCEKCEQ